MLQHNREMNTHTWCCAQTLMQAAARYAQVVRADVTSPIVLRPAEVQCVWHTTVYALVLCWFVLTVLTTWMCTSLVPVSILHHPVVYAALAVCSVMYVWAVRKESLQSLHPYAHLSMVLSLVLLNSAVIALAHGVVGRNHVAMIAAYVVYSLGVLCLCLLLLNWSTLNCLIVGCLQYVVVLLVAVTALYVFGTVGATRISELLPAALCANGTTLVEYTQNVAVWLVAVISVLLVVRSVQVQATSTVFAQWLLASAKAYASGVFWNQLFFCSHYGDCLRGCK